LCRIGAQSDAAVGHLLGPVRREECGALVGDAWIVGLEALNDFRERRVGRKVGGWRHFVQPPA